MGKIVANSNSALSDGLCTVAIDLKMEFNWLNPPEDYKEKLLRHHKQIELDKLVYETKKAIETMLREKGV